MESGRKEVSELDLVFVCDCTGSMGSYIASAKENITSIIEQIQASEKRDVQFALIAYRDHPPQESTYVTKIFDFTTSVRKAKEYVQEMSASGGGDIPEAVTAALHAALNLPYRKTATKIVVIVADAPCHGLSSISTDGFPNGSPDGADPIIDARAMAERGIVLYSVGCEPVLGRCSFARDFFKAISSVTGGRYIPLGNANALPKVIIGGAEEEIHLNKVGKEVEKEAALVQAEADENQEELNEEDLYVRVTNRLQSKGIETTQLRVDDIGDAEETTEISRKIAECNDLRAVKRMLDSMPPPKDQWQLPGGGPPRMSFTSSFSRPSAGPTSLSAASAAPSPKSAPTTSYACQEAHVENAKINYSQVSRWMNKQKHQKPGSS